MRKVRSSRSYRVDRLIEKYGIDAKINEWSNDVTADCPRKIAKNDYDACGAIRPATFAYRGRDDHYWPPPCRAASPWSSTNRIGSATEL
jgi:hypothetical protein